MNNQIPAKQQASNAVRIGITCFFSYMACYFGKNILSAMMPQLLEIGVFDDAALGRMASLFLITYGSGHLINGAIGDRIGGKYMIATGLFLTGILLFLFPHCTSPLWGTVLWGVCGFLCSMLWGPIARIIGENTSPSAGAILITLMTVASTIGTLATQALAILGGVTDNYAIVFYICAALLCVIASSAFLYISIMERRGMIRRSISKSATENSAQPLKKNKTRLVTTTFVMMTLVIMFSGVVRNAVSFWVPTFLSQYFGYPIEISAALVMALPFFNVAGIFGVLWLYNKLKWNEKSVCILLFAVSIPLFALLMLPAQEKLALLSVIALFLASAIIMGAVNIIFSVYVLRFRDTGRMSGISGFFDFASYLLASVASEFFAIWIGGSAWQAIIISWCIISALCAISSAFALWSEKREQKNAKEN